VRVIIALASYAACIMAQTDTATLTGWLPTGGVISGALVKVMNRDTNISTQATTSESEQYFISKLRPGN